MMNVIVVAADTPADFLHEYHALIQPARDKFAASIGVRGITSPDVDAKTMAAFLLHFSALGVPITAPVDGWIRRAGIRCSEIGLHELGRALEAHAKSEAGHHQYHLDDFISMVAFWNSRWSPLVHPEQVMSIGSTRGGLHYCAIHEETIVGDTPYCQLAIEYEIELLPVELGPAFVQNCIRVLGQDILPCMTFITSHVEFDISHTKFNAHFLGRLLAKNPDSLIPLVAAGAAILDAFADHLTECWELGISLIRTE